MRKVMRKYLNSKPLTVLKDDVVKIDDPLSLIATWKTFLITQFQLNSNCKINVINRMIAERAQSKHHNTIQSIKYQCRDEDVFDSLFLHSAPRTCKMMLQYAKNAQDSQIISEISFELLLFGASFITFSFHAPLHHFTAVKMLTAKTISVKCL